LHTLCLLDLKAIEKQFLDINQAIMMLLAIEEKKNQGTITPDTPAVGIARAGSNNPTLKADFLKDLTSYNFGEPPYSLIFPGEMHFMEIDSLIAFAGAPVEFRRFVK
jgi:diphthamide biosynthesis methyltransferase